jgi:sugar lactone lactonase YvrE
MLKGVIGRATLYEFDLRSNAVKSIYRFDEFIAPKRSYLNDLRVDSQRDSVYISDSGLGAIIVLNLKNGKARRVLADSPTTKAEPINLFSNGRPVIKVNGQPMRMHVDGLALFAGALYYHSTTAKHLYRVPTAALTNEFYTDEEVVSRVEDLGVTPIPDGMVFDSMGNLYMGDLEHHAVVMRTLSGDFRTIFVDANLHWVDTLVISPTNELIFTDSRLNTSPPGSKIDSVTFSIYKMALPI